MAAMATARFDALQVPPKDPILIIICLCVVFIIICLCDEKPSDIKQIIIHHYPEPLTHVCQSGAVCITDHKNIIETIRNITTRLITDSDCLISFGTWI